MSGVELAKTVKFNGDSYAYLNKMDSEDLNQIKKKQ